MPIPHIRAFLLEDFNNMSISSAGMTVVAEAQGCLWLSMKELPHTPQWAHNTDSENGARASPLSTSHRSGDADEEESDSSHFFHQISLMSGPYSNVF